MQHGLDPNPANLQLDRLDRARGDQIRRGEPCARGSCLCASTAMSACCSRLRTLRLSNSYACSTCECSCDYPLRGAYPADVSAGCTGPPQGAYGSLCASWRRTRWARKATTKSSKRQISGKSFWSSIACWRCRCIRNTFWTACSYTLNAAWSTLSVCTTNGFVPLLVSSIIASVIGQL